MANVTWGESRPWLSTCSRSRSSPALNSASPLLIGRPGQREKAEYQFSVATNEYIGQGKEKAEYQCKGKVWRAARRRQRLG